MKRLRKKSEEGLERVAIRATRWIGSTNSLIIHTLLFAIALMLYFYNLPLDNILLVLTTIVSLEAIYLSIFIQMSVNRQAHELESVAQDVDEIQEDVDEIQKDVEEIQEDVEDIEESDDEHKDHEVMLGRIENTLSELIKEINELKKIDK